MKTIKEGALRGSFTGFGGNGTLYKFVSGECWRQVCDTTHSHRAFMPEARIMMRGDKYYIQVDNIDLLIEVVPGPKP